jgi:hypothetical protein
LEVRDSSIDDVAAGRNFALLHRSKQPEPPKRLLNRRYLFWRARILFGRGSWRYEAELLFAVQNARALGYEAVLA